jgi:hypothetical protein
MEGRFKFVPAEDLKSFSLFSHTSMLSYSDSPITVVNISRNFCSKEVLINNDIFYLVLFQFECGTGRTMLL